MPSSSPPAEFERHWLGFRIIFLLSEFEKAPFAQEGSDRVRETSETASSIPMESDHAKTSFPKEKHVLPRKHRF